MRAFDIKREVVRTVSFELVAEEIEQIVIEHLKRAHGAHLRDFDLKCELMTRQDMPIGAVVKGTASRQDLLPKRKGKRP